MEPAEAAARRRDIVEESVGRASASEAIHEQSDIDAAFRRLDDRRLDPLPRTVGEEDVVKQPE